MDKPLSKRGIDIALCLLALPIAAPLCLLLLPLIRLESPGSPLFVQTRLGRGQRPFRMLKLRTMARGTGDMPSHEAGEHRITRLGRVIRALKLDELPQLLNVLVGSMSLVGPRPCLPSQTELIAERKARGVFDFRPGITGPAQLLGVDMSEPARLARIEEDYYRRATPRDDIRMILKTAFGSGYGDAAVRAPDG
jgi:lipopolysaccharide/colanic/teichoic acid biosynthesis glycosyltransferase